MPDEEARRRAAALEALKEKRVPLPPVRTFWQRNGGRLLVAAGLVLALALVARAVGSFLRHSTEETGRAGDALRKGMR